MGLHSTPTWLLLTGLTLWSVAGFQPGFYENKQELSSGKYTLHWKVESDTIYFAIEAKTTGWVGLGIAEQTSGSMPGADIVTGGNSSSQRPSLTAPQAT